MRTLLPLAAALGALPIAAVVAAPPAPVQPAAFARCAGCHGVQRGEAAEIGPNLWGVAGAKAGARPGYGYSPALKGSGVMWSRTTLTRWLTDDQKVAPGTTMPNQALSPADREAIVTYLLTLK